MRSASATIPVGYKLTEVGVIPEDWDLIRLEELADVRDGTHESPKYTDSGVPLVTSKNIIGGKLDMTNISLISIKDAEMINQRSKVDKGDILISMIGTIGASVIIDEVPNFCIKNVGLIKPYKSKFERLYLIQLLQSKFFQSYLVNQLDGGIQKFISLFKLRNLLITLPSNKDEQQVISNYLADSDSQIQALEKLISKMRDIKQGTMQELLTGKTRLPGFSGEWDVKPLGQIGEISGAGVDKKIVEGETPVRLVNYLDVYNRSFIYSNELDHHVTAPASKAIKCRVRKGDVFFTPTSEVRDDIAVTAIAMEDIPDGTYSYHVVRLRIQDDWDLNYRAYAFQTKAFLDQAAVLSDGSGTRYVISLPNFRKLKVLVPSKLEQQAIGQILSDMDAEIAALEQRLEKTKAIKQGMMQQLLTGRIRLVDPSTPVEVSA